MTIIRPFCLSIAVAVGLLSVSLASQLRAGEIEDLKAQIEALQEGQAKIQADVTEIKNILIQATGGGAAQTAQSKELSVAGSPFMGPVRCPGDHR